MRQGWGSSDWESVAEMTKIEKPASQGDGLFF